MTTCSQFFLFYFCSYIYSRRPLHRYGGGDCCSAAAATAAAAAVVVVVFIVVVVAVVVIAANIVALLWHFQALLKTLILGASFHTASCLLVVSHHLSFYCFF